MRESEIASELKIRLPEILPAKRIKWGAQDSAHDIGADLSAEVDFHKNHLRLLFELKDQPNLASLRNAVVHLANLRQHHRNWLPVIVSPHFNPEMRKLFRQSGQAYVDLSGNAWIEAGPVLIDKEVSKNLYPHQSKRRSPFADKATLVLRYLLDQKELSGRVREISRAVELSSGYVSTVIESAVDHGFARVEEDGKVKLRNLHELLLDWSSAYSWKRNEGNAYYGSFQSPEKIASALGAALKGKEQDYALTLHAGNNQIHPFAPYSVCHLYNRRPELEKHLVGALGLEPVAPDAGNVVFLQPYYRKSAFYGSRIVDGMSVVSDVQLYLDLKRFPVRGEEASEFIYERRLKPRWEKALG